MVKLRLTRIGKKHKPIYKIVAADSRSRRDGRFIEAVGTYDPNFDPMQILLKEERIMYWLKTGAQPTDTVRSLLKREGLIHKWTLEKKGKTQDEITSEMEKYQVNREARAIREKEKKARRKVSKKTKKKESEAAK